MLAACSSFRPVYGDVAGLEAGGRTDIDYESPVTRLDQVLYTELRLRLGPDTPGPSSYRLAVTTTQASRVVTHTSVTKPTTTYEVTVTGAIGLVSAGGQVVFSGVRKATALYTTAGQVLADTTAQNEAAERAARALADTVRLAVLGALADR